MGRKDHSFFDATKRSWASPAQPPRGQSSAKIIQPKIASGSQSRAPLTKSHPTAPAVYRPQPVPKVLQGKMVQAQSAIKTNQKQPAAPPAYRPQPMPKVLQPKAATTQQQPGHQTKRAPVAPPAYRPQPVPKVLQTKNNLHQQQPVSKSVPRPITPQINHSRQAPRTLQAKLTSAGTQFDKQNLAQRGNAHPAQATKHGSQQGRNLIQPARQRPGGIIQRAKININGAEYNTQSPYFHALPLINILKNSSDVAKLSELTEILKSENHVYAGYAQRALVMATSAIPKIYEPKRMGLEQELPGTVLTDKNLVNGLVLAQTEARELGVPVFKLETEGVDRGSPCIEFVHGPLTSTEYQSEVFKSAKSKLLKAISKTGNLGALFNNYNISLTREEQRYKLTLNVSLITTLKTKHRAFTLNTQTNLSVPYSNLGKDLRGEDGDFIEMFEGEAKADVIMYKTAREWANKLVGGMTTLRTGTLKNLTSLFTHIIYQEAKYIFHRIEKGKEQKADKHKFHVMLKLSPEDAIMSILNPDELSLLNDWARSEGFDVIGVAIEKTFDETMDARRGRVKVNPEPIRQMVLRTVEVRAKAGRGRLSLVKDDKQPSLAYNQFARAVGKINHTHPRPSNRIPVSSSNGEYYMVVEQRSAKHKFNKIASEETVGLYKQ